MSSSTLHLRTGLGQRSQHVIICGDDGLVHRLAQELDAVCGEAVTVVLPSLLEEVTQHHAPPSPSRRRRAYGGWLRDRIGHLPWKIFVAREVTAVFGAASRFSRLS
ncbi:MULTISPECIES: hypothetical protein [unclassified Streptomyces]|uniref:hypothetical protein n=1 Tax=unclassified Streptomyces TaxID=2593676 RepID=UPI00333250DB